MKESWWGLKWNLMAKPYRAARIMEEGYDLIIANPRTYKRSDPNPK